MTSFLPRKEIEAGQLEQLRSLVAELFPGNRFYSEKLQSQGITFDIASLQDFSARFPFTTKEELLQNQRLHPPFGTNLTYPIGRYTRYHQTSGSSGAPLRWLDTPDNWDAMLTNWIEIYQAAGATPADRVYFAFSYGPFIGFWLAFESAARMGCLCLPGGGLSSVARLRAMRDNQATLLTCTPTYALRLAEVAAEEKLDLKDLPIRLLIVAGEPGGSIPAVRARIESVWPNARVFDHHGMTEVGPVTYECPRRPGVLHVMELAFYAEIIDSSSGRSVPPGQLGELVLTTLNRVGSPLLRYRTGDLVRSGAPNPEGAPCICGRWEMTLEGGILGRVDEMVFVRGVNVYPSAVEQIVRSRNGVAEFQVVIHDGHSLAEMELRIEPGPECTDVPALTRQLERDFESTLALRVPVSAVKPGTLPRPELKAKRWIKA